jgi:hypothetical protein
MPAAASAAKAPGKKIKFRKNPVFTLYIIVQTLYQIATPARKRMLFLFFHELVDLDEAFIAEALIKCTRQKSLRIVAQNHLGT